MFNISTLTNKMTLTVAENDIDVFGHMNYIRYINHLETARANWFADAGMSFEKMVELNTGIVLLKFNMHYIGEAILGDELTIETIPVKLGTKSLTLTQKIFKTGGVQLTEAEFTFVMFDTKARKSIPIVEEFRRQFAK
ncbi:acyl-CoA thioesterase [Sporosarcina sp. CAU 1771]